MFKVYKKQIPDSLINSLLVAHKDFKRSAVSIFRAQGTTSFERPLLDQFGNQRNSIHNPHLLGLNYLFSSLIEQIILHENISKCLTDFTGSDKHVWYQSMFFDKSTGTKLHQDTWYLDTNPNGKLVGVWIALEDIEETAGPFCIYSNSDTSKLDPLDFDFENLDSDFNFKSAFPNAVRYDFTAGAGDILIWDSLSIHGALLPDNEAKTRKSITAHFYPLGLGIQGPPVKRFLSIYGHKNLRNTINSNIAKSTTINPISYQLLCVFLYVLEKLQLKRLVLRERSEIKSEKALARIRNL
jgi:phytanoyl-CoA hydroxylase